MTSDYFSSRHYTNNVFKISMLFLFLIPNLLLADTLDVTKYYNVFSGLTGIYDSPMHGLIISSSAGTYIVDKESGNTTPILTDDLYMIESVDKFFEYEGNLYLHDYLGSLYKFNGTNAELFNIYVVSHFVKDTLLYLLRDEEPRIQVYSGDKVYSSNLGNTDDSNTSAIKEYNGIVYCLMGLNWSGDRFFFKMVDNYPEYIIDPNNIHFYDFRSFDVVSDFVVIDDEVWFTSYQGLFKLTKSGISTEFDENMTQNKKIHYSFEMVNNHLIGLTDNCLYSYNFETKEETIIKEFGKVNRRAYKINGEYYYLINQNLYKLNETTMQLDLVHESETVIRNFCISQNGLFKSLPNQIKWHSDAGTKTFGGDGLYTNIFFSFAYDRIKDKLVALGKSDNRYVLQSYDGKNWSLSFIPDSIVIAYYDDRTNLEIDYQGRYFFAFRDILAVYDGGKWTKHSLLFDPNNENVNQSESYSIALTDSTGCVWINANLSQVHPTNGKWKQESSFWKYDNNKFNHIVTSDAGVTSPRINNSICMTDGTIYFDVSDWYFLRYRDNDYKYIQASDGIDKPNPNNLRRTGRGADNELIVTYDDANGWRSGYGQYKLYSGASVLMPDNKWDHTKYKEIALKYLKNIHKTSVITDKYNKTWLYNNKQWLRMNGNNSFSLFYPSINYTVFSSVNSSVIQYKGDLWFASDGNGLFRFKLPDPATTVEDLPIVNEKIILSIYDNSNIIQLNDKFPKFTICSIDGNPVINDVSTNLVDISSLPSGGYFIVVENGNTYIFEKFMIVR